MKFILKEGKQNDFYYLHEIISSCKPYGLEERVAEVNELTSVKKKKPTSPLQVFPQYSLFVLEVDLAKKECTFPSRRWLGRENKFKGESTETDRLGERNVFTRVLKEIHYPDLSQISHFTTFCAICW